MTRWARRALLLSALVMGLSVGGVIAAGFVLDSPIRPLEPADAIVVISGDTELARFWEGMRLYQEGWGRVLLLSGAAEDSGPSNAMVMADMARAMGVPASDLLVDPDAMDTYGNAVNSLRLLRSRGLTSALVVTSPYHVRRTVATFQAVFRDSGVDVRVWSAPDPHWRKASWWLHPDTRSLTISELQKLLYIAATGRYH